MPRARRKAFATIQKRSTEDLTHFASDANFVKRAQTHMLRRRSAPVLVDFFGASEFALALS
jgi:hypothetical protein